jgi:hypothetical protein
VGAPRAGARRGSRHRGCTPLNAGAPPPAPPEAGALRQFGDSVKGLGLIEAVASAVATAGVLYVVGGAAVLIRLAQTRLPVEQGLYVMPRDVLLLLGVREFLVAVAVAVVVYGLTIWSGGSLWIQLIAVAVVACVVPLTYGGLVWPSALLAAIIVSRLLVSGARAVWLPIVVVGLMLVAVVSRYTDPPFRFPRGSVFQLNAPPVRGCPRYDSNKRPPSYCGAYLGSTSDSVFIGIVDRPETSYDEAEIVIIPRDEVRKIFVSSPPTTPAPRTSLLGRVVDRFGPRVSCTPLECWVGDHNYGARELG